ncbi:MAG TPA: diacylglycerol kinase family protein [Acidimicrobiales bacterium]|nr:diacylglycerol kinase family protein [Acidimicrobiales bacterium]
MRPGVVFVNPQSGRGDVGDELARCFAGHRLVECEGEGLRASVEQALADGAGFVGVAGGDGSIGAAAAVLAGTGVPLLAVPAGTRNHFARHLGIETLADAAAASNLSTVDLGQVNGRVFVNNSSIGFYAALVRERRRRSSRLPRAMADLSAAWAQARKGHRFRVRVGGVTYRAWLVFVGNGRYGDDLTRDALDEQTLDVRVMRADRPLARTRAVAALLFSRLGRSPLLVQRLVDTIDIDVLNRSFVDVALDGEVVRLENPLRYEVLPGALTVLVP